MPGRPLVLLVLTAVALLALRATVAHPGAIASTVVRKAAGSPDADSSTASLPEQRGEPRALSSTGRVPIGAGPERELQRMPGMALVDVHVRDQAGRPIAHALVNATGSAAPYYQGRRAGSRLIWTDDGGRAAFLTLPSKRLDVSVVAGDGARAARTGLSTPGPDEETVVVVELPDLGSGREVVVFVRSSTNGLPIEGASVSAQPELTLGIEQPVATMSDEEGRALATLHPGDGVRVRAPGHSPAVAAAPAGNGRAVLHVELEGHARIEGRVVIAPGALDRRGSATWTVRLFREGFAGRDVLASPAVGADGRWSIDAIEVAPGLGELTGLTLQVSLGGWNKRLRTDMTIRAGETLYVEDTFSGERVPEDENGRRDGWWSERPSRVMTDSGALEQVERPSANR